MVLALALAVLWAPGVTTPAPGAPLSHGEPVPTIVAAYRSATGTWLLGEDGAVYRFTPPATIAVDVRLRPTSGGVAARRSLSGFARSGDHWIAADGSPTLFVFNANGVFERTIALPVPSFDVFASGTRVYVYDAVPDTRPDRIWYTTDLRTCTPLRIPIVDASQPERSRMLAAQLLFAPTHDGGFTFIHGIGEPVAHTIGTDGRDTTTALAYNRTGARARLTAATAESDINAYSAPARDALRTADHELIVLRNREDVTVPSGTAMQQSRRVDRYDRSGRLVATAMLPVTGRWILAADHGHVMVLTPDGHIVSGTFGPPAAGRLIDERH